MLRLVLVQFFSMLGLKLWPHVEPFFKRYRRLGLALFIACILGMVLTLFVGCITPRTHSIFALDFSEQAPRVLMKIECRGIIRYAEGVAVCEEKTPRKANIQVKGLPVPGRIVYSDGIKKHVDDFNYTTKGWWIFKKKKIDTTWLPLDIGELNSLYGDIPIAIDVQGKSDSGIINIRGVIYHRVCNEKDIPCSRLVVDFDCSGLTKNTYEGQLGSCARLSGSSQKFRLNLKTPLYALQEGAKIRVRSGRSGWKYEHTVSSTDQAAGEVKFFYPQVMTGPDLIQLSVFQWEQGLLQEYHTTILLVGYSPKWTGIDKPHLVGSDYCLPFTADLLEVNEPGRIESADKGCISLKTAVDTCAYAYDRESGDASHSCVKLGKERNLL